MCLEGIFKVSVWCLEGVLREESSRCLKGLTVEYFESSWNLKNLELKCGPAQPDLFLPYSDYVRCFLINGWIIHFIVGNRGGLRYNI